MRTPVFIETMKNGNNLIETDEDAEGASFAVLLDERTEDPLHNKLSGEAVKSYCISFEVMKNISTSKIKGSDMRKN